MKRFKVENIEKDQIIVVDISKPPYEIENILYKTGWREEDVVVEDITPVFEDE